MGHKILPRLGMGAVLLAVCAGAGAQNAMTTTSADLYAGPDDSYPQVAQLDSNTPVQVYGCLDDWSWCDVGFQDARGWLYSPDITYAYQGGYVPLYSYAPSLGIAVVPFSVDVYWGHYYAGRPWYGQRTNWEHRTINHRRPSGPPPSAGPPPRPTPGGPRVAGGHPDDHGIHLGSAAPPPHNAGDGRRPTEGRPAAPRPDEHAAPPPAPQRDEHGNGPGSAKPPVHEDHPKPMDHPGMDHPKPAEHAPPPPKEKDEDHPH